MKDSLQRMKSDGSSRSCASDASRSSKSKRHSHKVQHPPKPTAGSTNVNKLFWLFTMLFLAIHHSLEILFAPEGSGPEDPNFDPASPKHRTCVLTDKGYFCSEDEKEARRHARPTPEYYVTNFGVAQTVDGNGDENRKMTEVERNMNNYFVHFVVVDEAMRRGWDVGSALSMLPLDHSSQFRSGDVDLRVLRLQIVDVGSVGRR